MKSLRNLTRLRARIFDFAYAIIEIEKYVFVTDKGGIEDDLPEMFN